MGGAILGVAAAILGGAASYIPVHVRLDAVTVILFVLLIVDLGGKIEGLGSQWVIPANIVASASDRVPFYWGLVLGTGFLTRVPHGAYYAAHISVIVGPTPAAAAVAAGLVFGGVRSTWSAVRHNWIDRLLDGSPDQLRRVTRVFGVASPLGVALLLAGSIVT